MCVCVVWDDDVCLASHIHIPYNSFVFLETYGKGVETVVLCVNTPADFNVYNVRVCVCVWYGMMMCVLHPIFTFRTIRSFFWKHMGKAWRLWCCVSIHLRTLMCIMY